MNDIRMFVWLLPLLFILYDMEEVIFVAQWKKKEPLQFMVKLVLVKLLQQNLLVHNF